MLSASPKLNTRTRSTTPSTRWTGLGITVASGVLINMNYELLLSARWPGRGVVLPPRLRLLRRADACRRIVDACRRLVDACQSCGMACALLLSSVGNGFALDYVALNVALNESGVQLYIILHSTDTLFACIIAVLLAQARHPRPMGGGRGGRPIGLVVMGAPTPVDAQGNFGLALVCGALDALCLAAISLAEMHPPRRDASPSPRCSLRLHRGADGPPRTRARLRGRS